MAIERILGGCYVTAKGDNKGNLRTSVGGTTAKFRRMCEVYRIFSKHWEHVLDFSDESLVELFNHESYGTSVKPHNGFLVGKQHLNVNVAMWKEDIEKGTLFVKELYDGSFPEWWLDSVFRGWVRG